MKSKGALLAMSAMLMAVIEGDGVPRSSAQPKINAGGDDESLRKIP